MRNIIASVFIGYMVGCFCYEYDPQMAEWILYSIIPTIISFDKAYVGLQNYWALKAQHLSDAQFLLQLGILYAELYAKLLPTLGYDFLAQFDKRELIEFYLQCLEFNTEISLENILINASLYKASLCISPLLSRPLSFRKQEFFSSIKLKNLVYTKNVRSNFLNFYLKMVKIILFFKLRHTFKFKQRLTKKWKNC